MISMVAATGKNRVIGVGGKLPWGKTMPHDIQRYRELIDGKRIVMGSRTFEHPDHARDNSRIYVLSRSELDLPKDVSQVHTIEEIIALDSSEDELFVTGGGKVFELMIKHANKIYMTIIDEVFKGDTFFPEINLEEWKITDEKSFSKDENNKFNYSFLTYRRKK